MGRRGGILRPPGTRGPRPPDARADGRRRRLAGQPELGPARGRGSRWIFLPGLFYALVFLWLPPFCDRRDLLTIDGDATRYAWLALFVVGGSLRVAPMFVLGRRFSALVAIQENHELVTGGLYGVIRHPSYLGALVAGVGWVLVFRSALGLLLTGVAVWLIVARINAEEALLAATFGERYAAYRQRTWRLVPGIY